MEERDQIIIERYLAHELSEAERADVEKRRKDDALFNREVMEYELAREAIILGQREKLRQRFIERDKKLDAGGQTGGKSNTFRMIWVAVAAIVVISLLLWKFLFSVGHPSSPIYTNGNDSIEVNDQQLIDTPSIKESRDDKKGMPEERKMDMAETKKKGEELFAENFEPYKDDMMDPATRGESEPTPFDNFRQAYWDGRYNEVPGLFKGISSAQQENDNYRFQLANALLENGKPNEAISILESIIKNNRSRYATEAYFSLGMGYVLMEEMTKAKTELEKYLNSEKAKRKDAADNVLKMLGE